MTDYTVRSVRTLPSGHHSFTVVDRKGAVVHVTIPHRHSDSGSADTIIRHALASRTPHPPEPS